MSQLRTPPRHPHFDYTSNATVIFVTFCIWNRQRVFERTPNAEVMRETLLGYRERGWYWLLSFCIMPDHVHVLLKLRTAGRRLSTVVATLKNESAKRLRRLGCGLRWQYGYYDRFLRPGESETEFARYIVQNPVRAGLVKADEAYAFAAIVDRF
jgi:putative transposase